MKKLQTPMLKSAPRAGTYVFMLLVALAVTSSAQVLRISKPNLDAGRLALGLRDTPAATPVSAAGTRHTASRQQSKAQSATAIPASALAGLSPLQQGLLKNLASRSAFTPVDAAPRAAAKAFDATGTHNASMPALCFAPGTPAKVIAKFESEAYEGNLSSEYRLSNSWTSTATNGAVAALGTPITLTWSIVPDGTFLPARTSGGSDGANSNIKAYFNGIYGSEATWLPLFQQVFDRWSQVTGVTYVYQATDDGGAMPGFTGTSFSSGAAGLVGTRGDVRLGGRLIDGPSNVLAYNYFPNGGDMVIDTGDTLFNNTTDNSIRLRNTLWHEFGHGLGFSHVCPSNGSKLMEPFLNTGFAGPQFDDVLAAHRAYGDPLEETAARNNDTAANATNFGTLANGTLTRGEFTPNDGSVATPTGTPGFGNDDPISIDGTSDVDMFKFTVGAGRKQVAVTLHPTGSSYLEGPQNSNGTCPTGTSYNSQSLNNLSLQLIGTDGTTSLLSVDSNGAGGDEQILAILPDVTGPFYLRVAGADEDVQLYTLSLNISNAPSTPLFLSGGATVVNDASGNGNNNGRPDPGETAVALTIPVRNQGIAGATGVSATLTSLTATVTVTTGSVSYPNIGSESTASNPTPFVISVSPSHPCGAPIELQLAVGSTQASNSFNVPNLETGVLATQTFSYSGAAVPIPDGLGQNVTGPAATATITVSGATTIDDLNFAFDGTNSAGAHGLSHTWVGDLVATLTSPSGTVVSLLSRMGNIQAQGPNFVGTILDDEASTPIQTATVGPFTGSYTPAAALSAFDGENPNGTWTLTVRDEYVGDAGTIRAFSLRFATTSCDAPAAGGPTVTSFNPTSGPVGTSVVITGTGFTGATAVTFNSTSASFTVNTATQITATVPAGATTGRISVTAPSGTGTSATDFTVTVPTPTAGSDAATVAEDSGATAINVLGNDSSNGGGALSITTKTDGTNGTVTITGGGTGLTYAPNANYNGSDSFTYTISNGSATATATVTMTITAVNDPPTISNIADRSTSPGVSTGAIAFTVGDVETAAASLTLTRASSNTTLVPVANIVFGGSGANRTVTVTPATGQSGTATITVTVSDGTVSASDTFVLTVSSNYSISGRVATSGGVGISGVSVTRTGLATAALTDSSGNYSLTNVPAGTYTLTPTKSGYAFSPATRSVTVTSANLVNQNFTGTNSTLSGRVAFSNGVGIANVEVRLGTGRTILTNGAGFYTFTGMLNGAYTVTPVLAGYSFSPAFRQVTINNANVANINFTGGYAINGRVYNSGGIGLVGIRVYRTGTSVPAVTNSAGYFAFYGVTNGTYTLTPDTTQGYGYNPVTRNVTISGATVNNQNFIGTSGFSVSGRIATSGGTGISGVTVTRTGGATATTNSAGYYTFFGVVNGNYTVTPTRAGYTFTPTNRILTVNGANVANQNFIGTGP